MANATFLESLFVALDPPHHPFRLFEAICAVNGHISRTQLIVHVDICIVFAAAFMTQEVALADTTIKFEIWDTAGQERYHSLAPMYYRGAAAAVVVFDITEPASLDRAKSWVSELKHSGEEGCVIALAGNKCDLPSKIDRDAVEEYARENGVHFFETSAVSGKNIKEMFTALAERVPRVSEEDHVMVDEPVSGSGGCCSR